MIENLTAQWVHLTIKEKQNGKKRKAALQMEGR
jgi:hypothetical protein